MMGPQIVRVLRILCVLSVAICTRAFPQSYETGRMSNGKPYDHDVYPYVVALKVKEEGPSLGELSRVCSGTMISPLFAMTAAHCTYGKVATDITVFLGVSGQDEYNTPADRRQSVAEVYQHTSYNNDTNEADICLLKLSAPFPDLDRFAVISGHPDDFADGRELSCINIGFGNTEQGSNAVDDGFHNSLPDHGLVINVTIMYGKCALTTNDFERKEFLCAKANQENIRMCAGDSGGPVICGEEGLQYGVTSHSAYIKSDVEEPVCGSSGSEDHYVFVYNYKDWVYAQINDCTTTRPDGRAFIVFHSVIFITLTMARART